MRVLEHRQDAVHPRVNVALHAYELGVAEVHHDRRSTRDLRAVQFLIDVSYGMHGMSDAVVVLHPHFLVGLNDDDVWSVATAALLDLNDRSSEILLWSSVGYTGSRVLVSTFPVTRLTKHNSRVARHAGATTF